MPKPFSVPRTRRRRPKENRAGHDQKEKIFGAGGLGHRIQRARLDAGLSLDNVAEALNITPSAVRQWELGRKHPSRQRLMDFAKLSGADLGWLQTAISDTTRLVDESGRALGHPVPILDREQAAVLELPLGPDLMKMVPWVWPSYPCSDRTFAFKVFDDRNAPEFLVGEVVLIDPEITSAHGDMVLALGDKNELTFGKIVGLPVEALHWAAAEHGRKREKIPDYLEELIKFTEGLPDALINPRLEPLNPAWPKMPFSGRILGVMVQHNKMRRAGIVGDAPRIPTKTP